MRLNKQCVFDSNIFVSAALIENSIPYKGYKKFKELGGITLFSMDTFQELKSVLLRPKFEQYTPLELRLKIIVNLAKSAIFIEPERHVNICRDPDDNKFLALAIAAKADYVVSGDKDLLVLEDIENIPIITMSNFIEKELQR